MEYILCIYLRIFFYFAYGKFFNEIKKNTQHENMLSEIFCTIQLRDMIVTLLFFSFP